MLQSLFFILEVAFESVLVLSDAVSACCCCSSLLILTTIAIQRHPISLDLAGNPCPGIELQYLLFINI